jgi:hypothetical protein
LNVAIAKAKVLAGMPDEPTHIIRYPESKTFLEMLLDDLQSSPDREVRLQLPGAPMETLGSLWRLERVLAEGGVAAMLPGDISVQ